MERVRVLIADDHALFRDGLASLLRDHERIEVVGTATNGAEAIAKARELVPEVILMDLRMPDCDGIEATRQIGVETPGIRVLVLTVSEKDEDLLEAMKAGARGYIVKSVKTAELVQAITFVAEGHVVVAPSMAARLLAEFRTLAEKPPAPGPLAAKLTERETRVLSMVGEGLSNREIGQRLYVSEGTVKIHMRNILEKLQLHNRIEAAVFAAKQGLIGPPST